MLKLLDGILRIVSSITMIVLALLPAAYRLGMPALPRFCEDQLLPVLTAAAVGYLTNYLAVWLLFRPYEKHFGLQGVIPRNREKLGRELGKIIPEYLLDPVEITDCISRFLRNALQDPQLLADLRSKADYWSRRFGPQLSALLMEQFCQLLNRVAADALTREKLLHICDTLVMKWLGDSELRSRFSREVIRMLQSRSPELTDVLRATLREGAAEYMRQYPLAQPLHLDDIAEAMVEHLNWDRIELQLKNKLEEEETREMLSSELVSWAGSLLERFRAPECAGELDAFLAGNRAGFAAEIQQFIGERLPLWLQTLLQQETLWNAVGEKLLPRLQSYTLHRLKQERSHLIGALDLPGKIERSVNGMDMPMLHKMLLRAADDNLTAIQVLGYWLGGIAGLLLGVLALK